MKHLLMTMLIALLVVALPACNKPETPADANTVDAGDESIVQPEEVYEERAAAEITDENAEDELARLTRDVNDDTD